MSSEQQQAERNWVEIPPYAPTRYHQKNGIFIHSDFCMTSEVERVVREQIGNGYRYSIQRVCRVDGWITLSPFSQFIKTEDDAFAIAHWRKRRQEDPAFDEPAPWKV